MILSDFNDDIQEKHMMCSCDNYNLERLIKQPTFDKNPDSLTCIDVLLTNATQSFQSACILQIGLSDFH